jgi:hypothetical protein
VIPFLLGESVWDTLSKSIRGVYSTSSQILTKKEQDKIALGTFNFLMGAFKGMLPKVGP